MANSSSAANATAIIASSSTINSVQAASAGSFVNSVGVNAHMDSGSSVWTNTQRIGAEIAALGVKHVRDGTPYDWALPEYVALAKTGVVFDLSQVNPTAAAFTTVGSTEDAQRAVTLVNAVPGSVESMEGANEYNISSYSLNGSNSYGNLAWGAADDASLQAAVAAAAALAGVTVVAASTALIDSAPNVSAYVGASNWHVYGGVGEQLGAKMAAGIAAAQATAPGKPVYVTETGISSSGYGSATWGVTDEATQGIILTNALLESFKDGAFRTFLYELQDDTSSTPQENQFGLFRVDGSAKPAATDIGNLLHLLSDPVGSASKPLGSLAYGIAGLPSTASSMLLQKSDGTFDLVVWNGGATLYNGTSNVTPPASNITVTFASAAQAVSVYDPVSGLAAVQSNANASSVSFGLSKDPVILEIKPAAFAPLPTSTATDTLQLGLSEDAWQGDAQAVITVDGKTVGGTVAVTASHSQGQSQTVTLTGQWGPGAHDVGVQFINDAYGGTSSTDRNLYVGRVSLDGRASASPAATLWANGTAHATTAASPLVLQLSEDAWQGDAQFTVAVDGKTLGAAQSVSVSHASGGAQNFAFGHAMAAGTHDVAVSFLNDAWGGTAATDRNLYVNAVDANGATGPGTAATLLTTSTRHFSIVIAPLS